MRQADLGPAERRALGGAGEDDVVHLLAAHGRLGACAPSTQAMASTTFDLPDPFGPTTTVTPGSSCSVVASANDLKPLRVRDFRNTGPANLAPGHPGARAPAERCGDRPGRRCAAARRCARRVPGANPPVQQREQGGRSARAGAALARRSRRSARRDRVNHEVEHLVAGEADRLAGGRHLQRHRGDRARIGPTRWRATHARLRP